MTTRMFSVPEVHCGHCVSSIEGAVGRLEGVESVAVDLDTKQVEVTFDQSQLPEATIIETIQGQGYDVTGS